MRAAIVFGALVFACAWTSAQEPKVAPKREQGTLKVGDPAPAFELADADGKNAVALAELRGKPVVLVFGSCT